ncbi:hypothetical protein [Mycobacterium pseudokansasii]|uniref:hypothetical protein n=1 Tax=Mycobacterium pseudokansasii TaxID=2341080 RepID=UPI0010A95391|nr:hypothetical protein [Mycobacterium pseudokansasii]
MRAKVAFYAAEDLGNDEIAACLDTPRQQVLERWVRLQRQAAAAGNAGLCCTLMNVQSWNVCVMKTSNYVWAVSF